MYDPRKIGICVLLFSLPFIFTSKIFSPNYGSNSFHTEKELTHFAAALDTLPGGYNGLFAGSGKCVQCHGFDTLGVASVDLLGNDINVLDDWRATMMANSAKDPFWRAKVSHEVIVYPQHKDLIETKCTACHAPLGHFAALHNGIDVYNMDSLSMDSLAMDGVSCLSCHQQGKEDLGFLFSGEMNFDTAKVAYGPFISPLVSPMANAIGYEPKFSTHISDAGICAGCHSLVTETIDFDGNLTGEYFVEQATYHEWLNSKYEVEEITCQACHMPVITKGQFFLVTGSETAPRDSFYLHELAGANTTMLKLLKENIDTLQLDATPENFDEVIAATENLLRFKTLNMELSFIDRTADTAYFELYLRNKAGHKFPSGYPSRRAFVQFNVVADNGDTLFVSGRIDDDFEVDGHNETFEPHYNMINAEDQVQIYELVIGDVNGDVTTVLERGSVALKDNRLPPEGFTTEHTAYDTTLIAGNALLDSDFNVENNLQGSGADIIRFNIPMDGVSNAITATANIYYQPLPPKWMEEMFAESSYEIDFFKSLFEAADREPFLMKSDQVEAPFFSSIESIETRIPCSFYFAKNNLQVNSTISGQVSIFDLSGKLISSNGIEQGESTLLLDIPRAIYVIQFQTENGAIYTQKVPNFQ